MFSTQNKSVSSFSTLRSAAVSRKTEASITSTHSEKLTHHIACKFNDATYSDAIIQIHDVTVPVHKFVICTQSEYFETAFQKETFKEGRSGTIEFRESSGAAYWRVFEFLYKGDYSEALSTNSFEDDSELLKDPRVYALADMFLLEDLKMLSVMKLRGKLEKSWMSDSFSECIREVYASTSDSKSALRSAVVTVATAHAHDLGKNEDFYDLLREGGDFATEYIRALVARQ